MKSEHFKMEGLHTVKTLLQKNNWMAKTDLKDAFFMIPMAPQCHHLLCFRVGKRSYQFNCLPFSLCTAPRVFTKTLKPVVEMLRSMGLRVVIYIDDVLLMASFNDSLTDHIHLTMFLLENTGFVINEKKPLLEPTQEIEFLGMVINSKEMDISLPGSKIRDVRQEARRLLNHPNPSAHGPVSITSDRQAECNHPGTPDGSPLLPGTPDLSKTSSGSGLTLTRLPITSSIIHPGKGGPSMVGT